MGQVLHGTATTTYRIRKEIQASKEASSSLAKKYKINVKTIKKWRERDGVQDQKCGKKKGQDSILSELDEQIIVEVRTKTLLPLDDLYLVLQAMIYPSLHEVIYTDASNEMVSVGSKT